MRRKGIGPFETKYLEPVGGRKDMANKILFGTKSPGRECTDLKSNYKLSSSLRGGKFPGFEDVKP